MRSRRLVAAPLLRPRRTAMPRLVHAFNKLWGQPKSLALASGCTSPPFPGRFTVESAQRLEDVSREIVARAVRDAFENLVGLGARGGRAAQCPETDT